MVNGPNIWSGFTIRNKLLSNDQLFKKCLLVYEEQHKINGMNFFEMRNKLMIFYKND